MSRYYYRVAQTSTGGGGGGGVYLGPPSVRGLDFYLGDQQDDYRGYTSFRLQELVATGERGRASEYVDWCFREMRANSQRFFECWNNTGYYPGADPNFYDHLFETMELCKQYGGYGHPVVFCDQVPGSRVLMSEAQQDDHMRRSIEACVAAGNAFPFETENEPFKNGMVGRRYPKEMFKDLGVTCRGTWYTASDVDPEEENGTWLSCVTVHPGGDREWVSEGGHLCHEVMRGSLGQYPAPMIPCLVGEPVRIAEEGRTPRMSADHAWNCRNMGRGSLVHGGFHSLGPQTSHHKSDLQNCSIPTAQKFPDALKCCEAVRDVWASPLWRKDSASNGSYVRAGVLGPKDPVQFGDVPGIGHTRIFPQTDQTCPLTHWDRYIDAGNDGDEGPHVDYEDPRGSTRTYFMINGNRGTGGPLDPASQNDPEPRLDYRVVERGGYDGNIWVVER